MKKILFVLKFIFVIHNISIGQSNSQLKRAYRANVEQVAQDTFDIIPQPGEFPQDITPPSTKRDGTRILLIPTSWGSDLQKVVELKARLQSECKTKVHIRIIDTGQNTHPDLTKGKLSGTNYTTDPTVDDGNGHSTHCTGIVYSLIYPLIENGVATYENDKILNNAGSGSFDWMAKCETEQKAKDEIRKNNAVRTIVSASLGGGTALVSTVEAALKNNTFAVYAVANGNTGTLGVQYPGKSQYVAGIASLDQNLTVSSYSSFGPECWLSAPGRNINSTWLNGGYASLSGTSMATPHEAALFAIAVSKWGDLLPNTAAVKQYFAAIALDLPPTGKDDKSGYGYELINRILDTRPGGVVPPPPPPPPSGPPDTTITRPARTFAFSFTGQKWPMYWDANVPAANNTRTNALPKRFKVGKKMIAEKDETGGNALKLLTVTALELEVISTVNADIEYKRIKTSLDNYIFKNRGLGLFVGNDYGDACYWTAYFMELLMWGQQTPKMNVRVLSITGNDEAGNTITWKDSRLKHVPK
jgi:hypothetical protein